MIEDFKNNIMKILEPILKFLNGALFNALSGARWLLGALGSPFAMIAALGLGTLWALNRDKNPEETNKMIQNAANPAAESTAIMEVAENTTDIERRKQNILADRPISKKSIFNPIKDVQLQKEYLKEIGFDENTGLTQKEKEKGFTGINEKGIPVKKTKQSKESNIPNKTSVNVNNTTNTNNTTDVKTAASASPTAMPPVEPVMKEIPQRVTTENSTSSNQSQVNVNNSVNNIGGKPPKIQSTVIAKPRNSDLMNYLRNIAVPV
jgi:hypothetical protein